MGRHKKLVNDEVNNEVESVELPKATRDRTGYPLATSRLIKAIVDLYGGPMEFSRIVRTQNQNVNNWMRNGQVPLKHLGKVSRLLGVSAWTLNYPDLLELVGNAKPFEEIIDSIQLRPAVREWVFQGEMPSSTLQEVEAIS